MKAENLRRAGVSLIELLVVMLLLSIMVGIVVPVLQPTKFQMDASVVLVASTFTAQQKNAILRQHNIVVVVDSAAGALRVHHDADNDGTIDAGENFHLVELDEGVVFGRGGTTARPLGSAMNTFMDVQDGLPALTFRRNGSASAEAILYLTSERVSATAGTAYLDDARAIEFERATGRVRCYSHASGTWLQTC